MAKLIQKVELVVNLMKNGINFILLSILMEFVDGFATSPLNGVDLYIILMNATGLIEPKIINGTVVEINGILAQMVDWLSLKYNFSCVFLPKIAPHTEDSAIGKGAITYILSGEAEMCLGGTPPSWGRYKTCDFSTRYMDTPIGFLIPYPTSSENLAAVVKPFDLTIWLLLLASFPVTMASLYGLSHGVTRMKKLTGRKIESEDEGFSTVRGTVDYVANVFFSHGGCCSSKKLAIRLAAGAWCLGAFVIVTAYSSVLISFIISPNLKPIIESIRDIPKVPGLQVVGVAGSSLNRVWPTAPNGSTVRIVADQWRDDPSLLFKTREECFEQVREGNRVYPDITFMLASIMNKDHKDTGTCIFTIAKELLSTVGMSFTLRKNSPYTDSINKGILEMAQFGFIQHWEKTFLSQPDECLTNYNDIPDKPRISLKNLSGAFLILLVGLPLALLAFIVEKIVYYHKKNFGTTPNRKG